MSPAPILILGQGLAGTLLAWHLHWLGRRFLLLDRQESVTSSKIAAGIVTPITGKRVTLSQEIDAFLPEALTCYQRTAGELGTAHYHPLRQVRLFQNDSERTSFAEKKTRPDFARHLSTCRTNPLVNPDHFHLPHDGFEMATSGWLDTRAWLAASAAFFSKYHACRQAEIAPGDITLTKTGITAAGMEGTGLVFCEGQQGAANPWFPWLKWKSAKGDILTISAPELRSENRIIHRGGWLLPTDTEGTFRAGATYAWNHLDTIPNPAARAILENRLHQLLRVPWHVTAHHAAVRPILHQSLARMGRHPSHPALVFFNGLGSKGVLHGPRYARLLAENLVHNSPLPDAVDVAGNH